jgi:DNA-binding protein HU-beta
MTADEIYTEVAQEAGITKLAAKKAVQAYQGCITKSLVKDGDSYFMNGVGKFFAKLRKARIGRNPSTGEPVNVPERIAITFKPSKATKN